MHVYGIWSTKSSRNYQEKNMKGPKRKFELFCKLHVPGNPLILYNIWNPGSAQAVASAGAKALATSSYAVAEAHGFTDGEQTPLFFVIDNLRRIVKATELPVTVDLEGGYTNQAKPANIGETIDLALDAGAVGCNLEDSIPAIGKLRDASDQAARIRTARKNADKAGLPFFINARTDVFLQGPSEQHSAAIVHEAVERGKAYADAGADCLFVPGLANIVLIAKLVKESPLPINIMVDDDHLIKALADNGVARVSYGASPYINAANTLEEAARKAHA
jgi:2-methylisocitrate lyase-like PEP mutase family enzyme